MGAVCLPEAWEAQPDYPAQIDFGNPICQGLLLAYTGGVVSRQDGVQPAGINGCGFFGTPRGVATTTNGSSAQIIDIMALPVLNDFTLFAIMKDVGNNLIPLASRAAFNVQGIDILPGAGSVSGNWTVRYGASGGNTAPTRYFTGNNDGLYHSIAGTRTGTVLEIYGDGRYIGPYTGTSGSITSTQNFYQGKRGTNYYASDVLFCAVFSRALDTSEVLALHNNPWQVYLP